MLAFEEAVGLLQSGGVLLLGTDTLPGFHCRADLADSVARIQALKGRDAGKSMLVLAGSLEQVGLVTDPLEDRQKAYCQLCWPGAFSLILPSGRGLSRLVNADGQTVAVRVPGLDSLRSLVTAVGFPLVSTSVNRAGESPCTDLKGALNSFGALVDGAWQPPEISPRGANAPAPEPSALVDVTVWPPVQLRPGPQEPPVIGPGGLDGASHGI